MEFQHDNLHITTASKLAVGETIYTVKSIDILRSGADADWGVNVTLTGNVPNLGSSQTQITLKELTRDIDKGSIRVLA